jgi:hypothetical protein
MKHIPVLLAAALILAACGEQTQTIGSGNRPDTPAFQGTGTAFVVPDWKPGDKVSWEQELKTRTQRGQNEYNKVN